MSHVDSSDDELGTLLEETPKPDDSKESDKPKNEVKKHENDDYNEYDEDDRDPLAHKDMEDSEW